MRETRPGGVLGPVPSGFRPGVTRWVFTFLLATDLAFLGARVFNPYTGIAPHIDSGVYVGVAEHLLHGRVLYRGVWDHKPPMVYIIDAWALAIGDHTLNSVRTVEQWVAVLALFVVFVTDRGEALRFARAINERRTTFTGDSNVVAFIRAHSGTSDRIWNLIRGGSAVYAHTDRLSPTRFLYLSGFFFCDLPNPENAKQGIRRALAEDPPKFVLCDGDESSLTRAGLDEWFRANYTRTAIAEIFQ